MTGFLEYLRAERLPLIWCAGCGNGIVLKAILGAVDRLKIDPDRLVLVSGIGCSSRATAYVDSNTLHTIHGRAIAFATGIRATRKDLVVVVLTGDGDAAAIGGNHLIHAARRNIDLTVVVFNNAIYGMTGGQVSPATPQGSRATTAPHGNPDPAFDIARLSIAAGASLVARESVARPQRLSRLVERGIRCHGFALVEALTPCPTSYGRQNRLGRPRDSLRWLEEHVVDPRRAESMAEEDLEGMYVTGVLHEKERPEYIEQCDAVSRGCGGEGLRHALPERIEEPVPPPSSEEGR